MITTEEIKPVRLIVILEDGCVAGMVASHGANLEISVLDKDTNEYKRAMDGDFDASDEDAVTALALDNEADTLDAVY